jgi:hypothetical protein
MIASIVIIWVTSGLLAFGILHSYYTIIPPPYRTLRLILGLLGGPIALIICFIMLYCYHCRLSKE